MKVLLLGATGLVGSCVLEILLANDKYQTIYAPTRRPLLIQDKKLQNIVVDFNNLTGDEDFLKVDVCFCCLGTTIKTAGSQVAFKRIDHDLVIDMAQKVRKAGCNKFAVISSVGANSESSNFYLKTKGEMENDLYKIGFTHLKIINPSLIIGKRGESRPLETLGQTIMPLFDGLLLGPLKKYRTIKAKDLAQILVESII